MEGWGEGNVFYNDHELGDDDANVADGATRLRESSKSLFANSTM